MFFDRRDIITIMGKSGIKSIIEHLIRRILVVSDATAGAISIFISEINVSSEKKRECTKRCRYKKPRKNLSPRVYFLCETSVKNKIKSLI